MTQRMARAWAKEEHLTSICGRYEGLDQRLFELFPLEAVSLGDVVLNGGETAAPLVEKDPNVLVVRTFSKSASLAGARLGYALGSEALIEDLKKLKYSTNPYSVNRTALCAGAAAIRDWACCAANCRRIAFERRRLTAELVKRGFELTDSSANFVLARPCLIGAREYMEALRERGILIRYLGGALSDWVRITIGTPEQMDALLAATDEILKRS